MDLTTQGLRPDSTLADGAQGTGPVKHSPGPMSRVRRMSFKPCGTSTRWLTNSKSVPMLTSPNEPPSKAQCKRPRSANRANGSRPHWRKRGHKNPCLSGLACDVRTLLQWFHQDVLAPNGLDNPRRTELYRFITDALARLESLNVRRIRPTAPSLGAGTRRLTWLRHTPRSGPQSHR